MIKAAADLHIHSCLSPCASSDMTPNNIVLMSKLKGLDVIAVCDHNHTGNIKVISQLAVSQGILLLPGIELETSEEIHLLCYFPTISSIEQLQSELNQYYQYIPNREDIFGPQWVVDVQDEPVEKIDFLLTASTTLDLYQAVELVRGLGGVPVPAHVDRESYSILSNLGSVPADLGLNTLEVSRYTTRERFVQDHPEYMDRRFLTSSDAHDLSMILERSFFMDLEERSIACLIEKLKGGLLC
ncbi:MAG: PHP domain-containing protein [Thermoclostridium sp.]|nr:PHP domain-containing protein [Thermoclostridium sp.]